MSEAPTKRTTALAYALGTHAIWGSMPLYLLLVHDVPSAEFVAWRILFTVPVALLCVALRHSGAQLRAALTDMRTLATLAGSAAAVAINWFLYVWAIQNEYIYAASLGYYVLPLVMMLLGMVFFGEKLSRQQWVAVALAAIGVSMLATGALTTLWLSLSLAATFGMYGLLRKKVAAGPLTGLAVESLLLLPFVAAYLAWLGLQGGGVTFGRDGIETAAILAAGPITALPLILFAAAARALPYTLIGFLQFISPTIVFVLGLTVFGEELMPAQLACFVLIWAAASLFTWELLRGSGRPAGAAPEIAP